MKKILSLMLIFVICLSLCACGACNCGCCEKVAAEAAVAETVPEETQSQEEKLTELLVAEEWMDIDAIDSRYIFLSNGYGFYSEDGDHYNGNWFRWVLDDNKLLVMVEPGVESYTSNPNSSNRNDLYTFDEEQGAFIQKIYHYEIHNYYETVQLIPVSRQNEFA
jgi:hypothetical protein